MKNYNPIPKQFFETLTSFCLHYVICVNYFNN